MRFGIWLWVSAVVGCVFYFDGVASKSEPIEANFASSFRAVVPGLRTAGSDADSQPNAMPGVPFPPARATADRPDDTSGPQIHALYVLPSDGLDERHDIEGRIENSVLAFNNWLAAQSAGRQLRLDTYSGLLDVTFFRLGRTDEEMKSLGAFVRDEIERQFISAGHAQPNKLYVAYYGGGSTWSCGAGAWPPTLPGILGAMYLHGTPPNAPPCDSNALGESPTLPGYFEFGMLHEILHVLGYVPTCAPRHTLAGHVSEPTNDLMYAGTSPWQLPPSLDIGNDDYFNHSIPSCPDFADSPYLE